MIKILLKILIGALGLFLVLAIFSIFYFKKEMAKPSGLKGNIVIEIQKGSSVKDVAANLEQQGVVGNEIFFRAFVLLNNKKINPGFYEITPSMSLTAVAELIDDHNVKLIKVTFPEGWRLEQMAEKLDDSQIVKYEDFVAVAKGNEGKLFPDTYLFDPKMEAKDIVAMMTANFDERTSYLDLTGEDLIIASFVEREAINNTERPLIAGIYRNRIIKGMKLEADPTVQYGKDNLQFAKLSDVDKKSFKFWKPIKMAHYLSVKSDFNTYLIPGLPPAPICNPGLASIEAAVNYQHHKYLYFLQNDGKIYPSENAAQHDLYRQQVLGVKIK